MCENVFKLFTLKSQGNLLFIPFVRHEFCAIYDIVDVSFHLHSSSSASVGRYPGTGLAGPDEGLWSLGLGLGLSPPVRVYSRYRSDLRNKG